MHNGMNYDDAAAVELFNFSFQVVCRIRFGSRKTNKMEELQRFSEREEFMIQHLKRMVETRESDWDTLTPLCSASYECGAAAKW